MQLLRPEIPKKCKCTRWTVPPGYFFGTYAVGQGFADLPADEGPGGLGGGTFGNSILVYNSRAWPL